MTEEQNAKNYARYILTIAEGILEVCEKKELCLQQVMTDIKMAVVATAAIKAGESFTFPRMDDAKLREARKQAGKN